MTTKTIRTQVTKSPTAVGRKDPSEFLKKIISSSRNSNYLQKNPKLQQRWESGFGPKVAIDWLNPAEQINDFKTSDYPAKQRVPAIEQNSFRLLLQKDSLICDQACLTRWHKFEIFLEKQKFSRKRFFEWRAGQTAAAMRPRGQRSGDRPPAWSCCLSHSQVSVVQKVYNTSILVYKCMVSWTIHKASSFKPPLIQLL